MSCKCFLPIYAGVIHTIILLVKLLGCQHLSFMMWKLKLEALVWIDSNHITQCWPYIWETQCGRLGDMGALKQIICKIKLFLNSVWIKLCMFTSFNLLCINKRHSTLWNMCVYKWTWKTMWTRSWDFRIQRSGSGQLSPCAFQDLLLVLLICKMGDTLIYICRATLKIRNYTHLNILCQMLKSSMSMHITKGINAWISTLILWDHFK